MMTVNRKHVLGHIGADDYFGTLATILDLLRQSMEQKGLGRKNSLVLKDLREELVYLQERFRIVRRDGPASHC
ncbi:MAG TPA: hypothetical protein VF173_11145 [Thermoanaerobaculia bacterium]|nr:hypothetical protein [Thermoanaerobaculia bacterium]